MPTQTGSIDMKGQKAAADIGLEVDQHFWYDSSGAHVTEVTQEEFTDPSDPSYHSGGNTLMTSTAVKIRDGVTDLSTFGASGAVVGENASGKSRTEIGTGGMQIIQNVNGTDEDIANLGYGPGNDDQGGTSNAPYYTFGLRDGTIGNYSVSEGKNTTASGFASHAEGIFTKAIGFESHAEGRYSKANGNCSHAEGWSTDATGDESHAEGVSTRATGDNSHSEGYDTTASGEQSHAEGNHTTASGKRSHAEGYVTTASGDFSHAGGYRTIAQRQSQTALGEYNIADTTGADGTVRGDYVLIIGNGTADNARSNALTVDWNGAVQCGDYSGNFKSIFDIFYPVGSYYETSDASFDPNVAWGGTWSLESAGNVHVSAGTGYTIGSTGGAATVTLDVSQIPGHTHTVNYVNYNRGTGSNATMGYLSSSSQTQHAESASTGGGGAHENMPPYIVVNRWHRTA